MLLFRVCIRLLRIDGGLVLRHVSAQQQLKACQVPLRSAVQLLKQRHSGRPQQPLLMRCAECLAITRHCRTCTLTAVPACYPRKGADFQLSRGPVLQVHPDLGDVPIQGPNEPMDSIYKLADGMLPMTALSM